MNDELKTEPTPATPAAPAAPAYVASDLSGTLTRGSEPLPPFTVEVINRLLRAGVPFAFVTGFNYVTTRRIIAGVSPSAWILALNGALCCRQRKIAWEHLIPETDARRIYSALRELDLPLYIFKGRHSGSHVLTHGAGASPPPYHEVSRLNTFRDIAVISLRAPDLRIGTVRPAVEEMVRGRYQVVYSQGREHSWLEITPPQARKDIALERWCRMLGGDPSRTLYAGDNFNDLDALRLAGTSLAVEDAPDPVKRQASLQAGAVGDQGVARWLNSRWALGVDP